jgi:hypothetical protein
MMKLTALAAAAAVSVVILAGCGGDNSSSVGTAPPATNATSGSATTGAASATTSGSGQNSAATSTPTFSGNANSDFCNFAKQISSSDLANSLSENSGDLKATFDKLQQTLQQAYDKAPSEIKNDLATVQSTFKSYAAFLAQYNYDFQKIAQAAAEDPSVLQKAQGALDDQKFTDATSRIDAYAQQVCGIQDTSATTS